MSTLTPEPVTAPTHAINTEVGQTTEPAPGSASSSVGGTMALPGLATRRPPPSTASPDHASAATDREQVDDQYDYGRDDQYDDQYDEEEEIYARKYDSDSDPVRPWLHRADAPREFLEDETWPQTRKAMELVFEFLRTENFDDIRVVTSGGLSLTFISERSGVVVQHFAPGCFNGPRRVWEAMLNMWDEARKSVEEGVEPPPPPGLKHLAEIFDFFEEERVIVVEKLMTLNEMFDLVNRTTGDKDPTPFLEDGPTLDMVREAVEKATGALFEYGKICQNDERLDNIGIKPVSNEYALFDYGMAGPAENESRPTLAATTTIDKSISSTKTKHRVA